jgi:RNA polymerase sigma-70 factor (ECF subfamily)
MVADRVAGDDDNTLLGRWRDGDRAAGNELFRRQFDALYAFFRPKVGDACDELIGTTLLKCVEHCDAFRGEAGFSAYLFAIARNELFAHWRKQGARGDVEGIERRSLADLGGSPVQRLLQREEERLLLEALRTIPVAQQIVLELYYWEGMRTPQLAVVLGVPQPTARGRLRSARHALEARLRALAGSRDRLRTTLDHLDRWAQGIRDGVTVTAPTPTPTPTR